MKKFKLQPAHLMWLLSLALTLVNRAHCSLPMKRLFEDLFTGYNRLILPVATNNSKVVVTVGLKLAQILDLNLKQQILSTNVWVEQSWVDYKLSWDPKNYGGIDMIHVPTENIWIPDIVLLNNADGNYELTLVAKARLYSNGTVIWRPPTMFKSTCEIDVEYFPFDMQSCYLRFGSWTYWGDEIVLRLPNNKRKQDLGIDLSEFYKNVEWDIIEVPAYYNEAYYDCCAQPFPDITFKIVIRRKVLFHLVNLILPVALMAFMNVSVFYLPADSNEKVTLSISILTSLIVFFLLMLEIIPASSLAVPLFGKYLIFTLALVCMSAAMSVYVLNIHHRSPSIQTLSPRMRRIFLEILPRLLNMDRPDPQDRSSLNRFRKKKIAQQMLSQSAHKVYDVAQPLAASLNLIGNLHNSYHFGALDDEMPSTLTGGEEEGRYFRRYVDNYIARLKRNTSTNEDSLHEGQREQVMATSKGCDGKCCARANQPLAAFHRPSTMASCCIGSNRQDITESSDHWCSMIPNTLNRRAKRVIGMNPAGLCNCGSMSQNQQLLNDDTLDMTFDYDNQDNFSADNLAARQRVLGDILPSPPPPPKQLSQLSDSLANKSGRLSSCSRGTGGDYGGSQVAHSCQMDDDSSDGVYGRLVDKLISSIQHINNDSDAVESTTSPSIEAQPINPMSEVPLLHDPTMRAVSSEPSYLVHSTGRHWLPEETRKRQHLQMLHQQHRLQSQCPCGVSLTQQNSLTSGANQHKERMGERPSELLLSLQQPYDKMPAHVRSAIRSILFIADTIKNEDDDNSAVEDWASVSMVVDRLLLWIFLILCTLGSLILATAPSLYDKRAPIDDLLRIDVVQNNCSSLHT